jgi:hypothetical protein
MLGTAFGAIVLTPSQSYSRLRDGAGGQVLGVCEAYVGDLMRPHFRVVVDAAPNLTLSRTSVSTPMVRPLPGSSATKRPHCVVRFAGTAEMRGRPETGSSIPS